MASVAKREWTHKGETKVAWVVRYTDQGGQRRMKTFDKKKEADRHRAHVEIDVERGHHIADNASVTMRVLCNEFLTSREDMVRAGTMKTSTQRNYLTTVTHDIIPFMGPKKAATIKYEDIEAFYRWMRDHRKVHLGTIRDRLWLFRRICEYGAKKGYLVRAGLDHAIRDFATGKHEPVLQFSEADIGRLLTTAAVRQPRAKRRPQALLNLVVNLAVYGGLRIGEILGLRLSAIDEPAGCVTINASLNQFKILGTPKTRSSCRTIVLPGHVMQMIADFKLGYYIENKDGLLLTTQHGEGIRYGQWHASYWTPLLIRAGLKDAVLGRGMHFHALRHFHASWLLDRNEPVAIVSERLGHSNPGVTMKVYAHALRRGAAVRPVVERMAAEISNLGRDKESATTAQQLA